MNIFNNLNGLQDRTTSFLIWVIHRIHHQYVLMMNMYPNIWLIRRWLRYLNCYCIGPTQDTFEANFEDWSRLFSIPNPQADPNFQTPVPTGRPGRDVGPPERHTYSTDHVHAQRKRGRHGRVAGVVMRCFYLFLYFCYGHVIMLYLFRSHTSPISFSFAYVCELLAYTFHIYVLY